MQSRLARCWSKACGKFLALSLLGLLGARGAWAEVTLAVPAPYSMVGDTAYYALDPLTSGFRDEGIHLFDLKSGIIPATGGTTNSADLIEVDVTVTSPPTVNAGESLVLVAYVTDGDDGEKVRVPIGAVEGALCNSGGQCRGFLKAESTSQQVDSGNTPYLFTAPFTTGALTLGFFPNDICRSAYRQKGTDAEVEGCTVSSGEGVANIASPGELTLHIAIKKVSNLDYVPEFASGDDSESITLNFQNTSPTITCPSSYANVYFPGDERIYVDPTQFIYGEGSNGAPVGQLVVVGELNAAADVTSSFTSNSVIGRGNIGDGSVVVEGFENSTATEAKPYSLAFAARDAAGIVGAFSCSIAHTSNGGVQTAEIAGFLTESKCFIATAAYGSGRVGPVMMLRRFRDQVLTRFAGGREFVRWYYDRSPRAAEWLLAHPEYRIPVLGALIPLQVMAWVLLEPALLSVLALGGLLAMAYALSRQKAAGVR